jgi:hypothetical protein
MFGLVFIIVAAAFVYRKASDNGYSAVIWTIVSVAVFFGVQVLVAAAYAAVVYLTAGEELFDQAFEKFASITGILGSVAGAVGMLLVLRHVSQDNKIESESAGDVPPPPSSFGLGE